MKCQQTLVSWVFTEKTHITINRETNCQRCARKGAENFRSIKFPLPYGRCSDESKNCRNAAYKLDIFPQDILMVFLDLIDTYAILHHTLNYLIYSHANLDRW